MTVFRTVLPARRTAAVLFAAALLAACDLTAAPLPAPSCTAPVRCVTAGAAATTVAFSPDGARYAAGGFGALRVFDTATGDTLAVMPVRSYEPVSALAFSPDGTLLATPVEGGVRLWDAATGRDDGARHGAGPRLRASWRSAGRGV